MSDEDKTVENEEKPAIEIPEGLTQADVDRGVRQGWSPKEEWKGDPDKWKDLKTFLDDGESILPVLKKNYGKLEAELNQLKAEREKDKKVFENFQEFQSKSEERAYKKALAEIEEKMAEAVESGDKKAFTDARREEAELREQQQPKDETKQPQEHPDWKAWKAENTWYTEDEELGELADAVAPLIARKNPNVVGMDFFELVKAKVKKTMPHKFENPNRNKQTAVEGAGGKSNGKGKGRTYSDLPADAKQACDEFVATIPGYTKEKYIKDYDWSQAS